MRNAVDTIQAPVQVRRKTAPLQLAAAAHTDDIRLSEVISALSYALDITEGQPEGHAVKSCLVGMRLAQVLSLPVAQCSELFYALLLKDLGCSSNAAKVCSLFEASDFTTKRGMKTTDWANLPMAALYAVRNAAPDGSPLAKAARVVSLGMQGPHAAKALFQTRCDRGAWIARMLEFPAATADAIRTLDEHWNGKGHPAGLKGEQIPLLGRIVGLAQTFEIFFSSYGLSAAYAMAARRRGTWFDPLLVDALRSIEHDSAFWRQLGEADVRAYVAAFEPADRVLLADPARLDRVAEGFAKVIDAKSPWTYRHSEGVAEIALGIAAIMGFAAEERRDLRRAALLHDIGKLGISNRILDKQGRLTDAERAEMCRHPAYSQRIIERVACFRDLAFVASAHHERLDGSGYHRGLTAADLPPAARVLAVADICDALLADRPYRLGMPTDQALAIMRRDAGTGICPQAFEALELFLEQRACAS